MKKWPLRWKIAWYAAALGVVATIAGTLDVGYDPETHVASVWFTAVGKPDVRFSPIGKLDVDAEEVAEESLSSASASSEPSSGSAFFLASSTCRSRPALRDPRCASTSSTSPSIEGAGTPRVNPIARQPSTTSASITSCSVSGSAGRSSRTGVARGTGPRPTRTVRKSASLGRRSQSRSVRSAVAHSRGR